MPLLQSTQNRKRLEHEWRKHQYHKTHKALEDWSKKVKNDTIARAHKTIEEIGARRKMLLLQSNRKLDQEDKRVLLSQSTTSEWGSTTKRKIALTILLLSSYI